jgi:nucleotide-binding universal stress UspA family protein
MFKSIVWATDGSEAADLALPYVKELAHAADKLTVVHCEEFVLGPKSSGYTVHADEFALKAKIDRQVKELAEDATEVMYTITGAAAGGAAHKIAEAAAEAEADLIIVGTRGHTALGGLLLGSVTQRLLHIGPCPVLAIPAVAKPAEAQPQRLQATTA